MRDTRPLQLAAAHQVNNDMPGCGDEKDEGLWPVLKRGTQKKASCDSIVTQDSSDFNSRYSYISMALSTILSLFSVNFFWNTSFKHGTV